MMKANRNRRLTVLGFGAVAVLLATASVAFACTYVGTQPHGIVVTPPVGSSTAIGLNSNAGSFTIEGYCTGCTRQLVTLPNLPQPIPPPPITNPYRIPMAGDIFRANCSSNCGVGGVIDPLGAHPGLCGPSSTPASVDVGDATFIDEGGSMVVVGQGRIGTSTPSAYYICAAPRSSDYGETQAPYRPQDIADAILGYYLVTI